MISKLTTELPCEVETLKRLDLDFTVQTTDDKLSELKNSSGKIKAIFTDASPRKTTGSVELVQGNDEKVLTIPAAEIQIEQGAPHASWPGKILGSITVRGVADDGRFWEGRSTGESGETSIGFEMATSDKPNAHAQEAELKKWDA